MACVGPSYLAAVGLVDYNHDLRVPLPDCCFGYRHGLRGSLPGVFVWFGPYMPVLFGYSHCLRVPLPDRAVLVTATGCVAPYLEFLSGYTQVPDAPTT